MRDKDKDKTKPGYKLRVRRHLANSTKTKPKQNRNQPKPQPTPKKDLPKLGPQVKGVMNFMKGIGIKPRDTAKFIANLSRTGGLRKPDDPRRRWS